MEQGVPFAERYRKAAENHPGVALYVDQESQRSSNSREKLKHIPAKPKSYEDFLSKLPGIEYEKFTHFNDRTKFLQSVITDEVKKDGKRRWSPLEHLCLWTGV